MQCLKCGKEIAEKDVFCADCLAEMQHYPIKPGTVALIPPQPPQQKRASERRMLSTEQKLKASTRHVRVLSFLLTLAVALLIGVTALMISLMQDGSIEPLIGQNYSTASTSDADIAPETTEEAE